MPNTNTNEDANTIVNAIGYKITLAKTDITTKTNANTNTVWYPL